MEVTRTVELTEKFKWEIHDTESGFKHRLSRDGKKGDWSGYSWPAYLSIGSSTYAVITDACIDAAFKESGKLYRIHAVEK
jgi:hypothetical protein